MTRIYKVDFWPTRDARYIWLLDSCGDPLVAGPDPVGSIVSWYSESVGRARQVGAAGFGCEPVFDLYEFAKTMLSGTRLTRLASVWADIDDGGEATVMKNRFGSSSSASLPFRSREEMAVVSAACGWPDPLRLDEALAKAELQTCGVDAQAKTAPFPV